MRYVLVFVLIIAVIIWLTPSKKSNIPKIIWSFWDGSEQPPIVKACIDSWKRMAPDYEIRVLDKSSTKDIEKYKRASDSIQRYTDFVRLDRLSRYGGVWIDASVYLTKPLDWIQDGSEFIGYKSLSQESNPNLPVIDSWFLACTNDCKYVNDWWREFQRMDSFDSVKDYLNSLKIDISKVYSPEYLTIHVTSMVVRSENKYNGMRLLVSENDAGLVLFDKVSLQEFCDGSRDSEAHMFKLRGANRDSLPENCKKLESFKQKFKEEPNTNKSWSNAIGNILSNYFYGMGISWSKKETYKCDWINEFVNDFYKALPREIPYPQGLQVPDYKSHQGFEGVSAWTVDSDEGKKFWEILKPYIHDIIGNALEKSGLKVIQKNPVIHFRCSDVPFNRMGSYHLVKYQFYKDGLKGQQEVDLISCHSHLSDAKNSDTCKNYVDLLVKELDPIKVNVKCQHYFEDFACMFYAPLVLSTGSSMSFMSGFFGHGKFLTAGHIFDEFKNTPDCTICSHPRSINLMHNEVSDYYDVQSVHKLLLGTL